MKIIIPIIFLCGFAFNYLMYEENYYCNADGRCFIRSDRITSLDTDLISRLRAML